MRKTLLYQFCVSRGSRWSGNFTTPSCIICSISPSHSPRQRHDYTSFASATHGQTELLRFDHRPLEQSTVLCLYPLAQRDLCCHVSTYLRIYSQGTEQAHVCGSVSRPILAISCVSCLQGVALDLRRPALERSYQAGC
jgi:hypothetical protein